MIESDNDQLFIRRTSMISNQNKQNFIWGLLLIVFGITALINSLITLQIWWWVGILFFAGLITIAVYWTERSNWAYLIPAYILWSIAGLITLVTLKIFHDEAIATYVLTIIALPFLVGYLRNRTRWGLMVPAYVLVTVGVMVSLIGLGWLYELLIPAYVMFAIAIPFLLVYILNPKNWWSLIPGGIMGIIGMSFLLATPSARYLVPAALVIVGLWIIMKQLFPGTK
jgi:hypothetical protein